MSLEDGLDLIKRCIGELRSRFLINNPSFILKVADKDGVRELTIPGEKEKEKPKEKQEEKEEKKDNSAKA